jgi:hypothetical protein
MLLAAHPHMDHLASLGPSGLPLLLAKPVMEAHHRIGLVCMLSISRLPPSRLSGLTVIKPHPVRDIAAVGVVRVGQAAGDPVPHVDGHRAGGAAVDIVGNVAGSCTSGGLEGKPGLICRPAQSGSPPSKRTCE